MVRVVRAKVSQKIRQTEYQKNQAYSDLLASLKVSLFSLTNLPSNVRWLTQRLSWSVLG